MTGEPDLISLLHRADWTRLSLAGELSDGSSLLMAPGRRYRRQDGEAAWGCDGVHPWEPVPDEMAGQTTHWITTKIEAPLGALLCPAWMLVGSQLEVLGSVRACGRDALQVVMTRRPSIRDRPFRSFHMRADRAEVIVDAELGILLRLAWLTDDEPQATEAHDDADDDDDDDDDDEPTVTEFVSLDLHPTIDPAQFAPPPGSQIGKGLGETLSGGGAAGWALRTAGGLAAGGLGALIKHTPHRDGPREADREDAEAAFPPADPAPELSPDGLPSGPPVSAEVLRLLQASGTGEFAATLHEWLDVSALMSQLQAGSQRPGSGGLGVLLGAISGPGAVAHSVSALRVGGPRRYQIDHADEPEDGPKTVICDGEHRWQVYGDKVTVGPAVSEPPDMADLADASWLLECRLSGGEPLSVGERPAFRVNVARGDAAWSPSLLWFSAAVAVVDAELGILLRLTTYAGGQPVRRYELRDVTAEAGEFRADLPPGLPTVEEEDPVRRFRDGHPPPSINIFQAAASAVGRQVAKEASNVARNLLRRLNGR
jgi:hypothetical protein